MNNMIQRLGEDQDFQDKLQDVNSAQELQDVFDEYQVEADASELYALLERARNGELTEEDRKKYAGEGELSEEDLDQVAGGILAEALGIYVGFWLLKGVIDGYNAEKERQKKKK